MLEIKAYSRISDDLPYDRLFRCYHRKPVSRMEVTLGWSLIRLSKPVNLCGKTLKKGDCRFNWLVQQNWLNRPTPATKVSFNQARKDFYIPKNQVANSALQEG